MAEATLNDVTKGLQQVSEAIREQTIADGKADPAKFLKEEFVSILSQRRFSKKTFGNPPLYVFCQTLDRYDK